MTYEDILCVGGPIDGHRQTSEEEYFEVLNSGPPTWHRDGSATFNQPTVVKAVYELVALDLKDICVMFYKDRDMTMEQALINLVEGYNPRGKRY